MYFTPFVRYQGYISFSLVLILSLSVFSGCQTDTEPVDVEEPAVVAVDTISPFGVGPILFGMTIAEADSAHGSAIWNGEGATEWGCVYTGTEFLPEGQELRLSEGVVERLDIASVSARTPEGIGIGSTLDEAKAAFGERMTTRHSKYGGEGQVDIIVLMQNDSGVEVGYYFAMMGGLIDSWRAGLGSVIYEGEGCM
jgi:hypothetical protein